MKHLWDVVNRSSNTKLVRLALAMAFLICVAPSMPANAYYWETGLGPHHPYGTLGTIFGISSKARDGYDGVGWPYNEQRVGIFLIVHHVEGEHGWNGPTGFYPEDFEFTPIPWGGSKTWWNFCLWSQNYTPPSQIVVRNGFEMQSVAPPRGYFGHIVIDQIPAGVTWTGPMEYWFDMTVRHQTFLMPIAKVTDPLQGTRFHLTVYTPEPSSLLALAAGIGGIGLGLMRKRRRQT